MTAVKCYPAQEPAPRYDPGVPANATAPWRAFLCNVALWRLGLRVPEPLGFFQRRRADLQQAAPPVCRRQEGQRSKDYDFFAVTRFLEGWQPLINFAFEQCRTQTQPRARLRLWGRAVVDSILALHQSGYVHGDLHHGNILIKAPVADERIGVALTDFDHCRLGHSASFRSVQQMDLARLGASLYEIVPPDLCSSLLVYYLQRCGLKRAGRKAARLAMAAAYHRIVNEYLTCYHQIEAGYFAAAEHALNEKATGRDFSDELLKDS